MKVLLVHVDGKFANPALMKLARYHVERDDEISLLREGGALPFGMNPDKVYVSCIFPQNAARARGLATWFPGADVEFGGPGFESPSWLPEEIEHLCPWYPLYDIDYDIGYTTRGCPKRCPFCNVPRIEGAFKEWADMEEFHDPAHKKVILLDNNFLYSNRWEQTLEWINQRKMKVNFSQGLDFQFLIHEKAVELAKTRLYPWTFKKACVCFAWDLMEEEEWVDRGLKILEEAGFRMWKIQVYVLVGYNTTHEQDLYRIHKLIDYGLDPFVMIYNHRTDDQQLTDLARWVNRHLWSKVDFKDFDRTI